MVLHLLSLFVTFKHNIKLALQHRVTTSYYKSMTRLLTCPCMSPHTVTGDCTGWTLDSSNKSSHTMSQSFCLLMKTVVHNCSKIYLIYKTIFDWVYWFSILSYDIRCHSHFFIGDSFLQNVLHLWTH